MQPLPVWGWSPHLVLGGRGRGRAGLLCSEHVRVHVALGDHQTVPGE